MGSQLALLGGTPVVSGQPQPWPPYLPEVARTIDRMLRDSEISYYGEEGFVRELEEGFERFHDVPYALATSSGTAALHSAFVACGLAPGDEVIAPSHTFLATVMPIFAANGVPVLVDCEEDSEGIDPKQVEQAVTSRTRAIVVTHLWGHPVDLDPIVEIARRHGLRVIEDCSHAHGATYRGRLVGTVGDIGCFSLQGKKAVTGGQGGILITRDRDLYERAVLCGHFRVRAEQGIRSPQLLRFAGTGWGLNYRMHPFSAALAVAMFRRLPDVIERRRQRHCRLIDRLSGIAGVCPPRVGADIGMGAWYGFKPRFDARGLAGVPLPLYLEALRAEGVRVDRPGSAPLHLSPVFTGAAVDGMPFTHLAPGRRALYAPGDLPVSERVHAVALSLPTFTYEPMELVDQYADAFEKVASHHDELRRYARDRA
jgi:dTDP-4-amino-4,6-dideoxygalactose transaminase